MMDEVHTTFKRTAIAVLVNVAACIYQLQLALMDMQLVTKLYTEL